VIEELADVPPEQFVAARDQLAARLKDEGDEERAAEVKKLRKPTVAQWLTSEVRRRHPGEIATLQNALQEVGQAQEDAVIGGDRTALQDATARRRAAAAALGDAVDDVLTRTGRPPQYRDEVLTEIEAAVSAEVVPGPLGLRDDLELPVGREPRRDIAAERRAAAAPAAIEVAEARVRRAREELARAETDLQAVLEQYGDA
jgi:hypothetical protein